MSDHGETRWRVGSPGNYRWEAAKGAMNCRFREGMEAEPSQNLGESMRLKNHGESLTELTSNPDRTEAEVMPTAPDDFLTALVHNADDAVIGETCEGLILTWNRGAERIYGYSADEVIGRPLTILEAPGSKDGTPDILSLVMNGRRIEPFYTSHKTKQGKLIRVSSTVSPVRDSSGDIIGASTIIRDVTAEKLADDKVRASRQFFENIFESIQEGLTVLDGDLNIVRVNQTVAKLFSKDAPLKGKKCYKVYHGLDAPCEDCPSVQALNTGRSARMVTPLTNDDGRPTAWIEISSFPLVDQRSGKIGGVVEYVVNISERKHIEGELHETLARLYSLVEAVPDVIYFKDLEGRLLVVNRAFEQFAGLTRKEIIGRTMTELFPSEAVEETLESDRRALSTGFPDHSEQAVSDGQGRSRWFDMMKFPVHDADERIIGLGGMARDITQSKIAEREREKLRRQLLQAQKMEAIGTLAGGIAHDFNNMLTVIQGYSELLLADRNQDDSSHDDLQKIILTAHKGAELVRSLLAFSRKSDMKPVPLNLNDRIEQVEKLLGRTLPRVVEIELRLSDEPVMINADPAQVDQIVMNLALNSSEAMPDGGRLTIETRSMRLDEEYCRSRRGAVPGQYVMLIVSDTGRGIDQHTLHRIFDPFFTTKERNARKGTGLGLSVVQGIIEQHGGHLTCESKEGHGATFTIYFPALEPSAEPVRAQEKPVFSGAGRTILMVDDEQYVRDLGKRVLERSGFAVLEASNGRDALDMYEKHKDAVCLVILDLIMPEMDGKQCLDELLKINPDAKILVATGFSPDYATKDRLQMSSKGWIAKPFNMKQLLHSVRDALE
jgi:two-component system cell cycle sensor histidine kinase/response regulator CckA